MTRIFSLMLAGVLAFSAVEATRAADGQISDAQLSALGLGGMQKMTDAQGTQIRGKFLWATTPGSTAFNTFFQLAAVNPQAAAIFAQTVQYQNNLYLTLFPAGLGPYGPANPIIK